MFFLLFDQVLYDMSNENIVCSCKRFERFGLLCRHIFYALRSMRVKKFPRKYICSRWTNNVVLPKIVSSVDNRNVRDNDDVGLGDVIRRIYSHVDTAIDKVIGNREKLAKYLDCQEKLSKSCVDDFVESDILPNQEFISEMLGFDRPENVEIQNPVGIRNKGGGTRKRLTTSRERAIANQPKVGRKCGFCGSYDPHNIRTCPPRLEAEKKKKEQEKKEKEARKARESGHEAGPSQQT